MATAGGSMVFIPCIMVRAEREANKRALMLRDRDPPWQLADLDRLDHPEARDVDDGHVVGDAICGQEIFLVRGERQVPDALTDEKILLNLMGRSVDHRNTVGGSQGDKPGLAVAGDTDSYRLDRLLAQARNVECDL